MTLQTILMRAALGAGAVILAIGLAVAQTAPSPAPAPGAGAAAAPAAGAVDRRAAREACRSQIGAEVKGDARREAMRSCMAGKGAAGPQLTEAERDRLKELRSTNRTAVREARKTCRESLKNEKLTEDERRKGIEDCIARANPNYAKALSCRREADGKQLEKRTGPYREFMRSCIRGA